MSHCSIVSLDKASHSVIQRERERERETGRKLHKLSKEESAVGIQYYNNTRMYVQSWFVNQMGGWQD